MHQATWFGRGPGDSYPDRRTGWVGHHHCNLDQQHSPYVVPQEFGHHGETHWVRFDGEGHRLVIWSDQDFGWTALPFDIEQLTTARHRHELVARPVRSVILDLWQRGLGTAACGPDTALAHRFGGGTYRFTWNARWEQRKESQ